MDWNDIQGRWQGSALGEAACVNSQPPAATRKLWQLVRRRDYLETGLAFLLLPVFAGVTVFYALHDRWVSVAFLLLVVVGIAIIPWQLWRTRRLVPVPDHEGSVKDYLQAELIALGAQEQQSRWAFAWYFLPIGIGCVGAFTSTAGFNLDSLWYAGAVAAIGIIIDWLNRGWAARKFQQTAKEIQAQLASMEAS